MSDTLACQKPLDLSFNCTALPSTIWNASQLKDSAVSEAQLICLTFCVRWVVECMSCGSVG